MPQQEQQILQNSNEVPSASTAVVMTPTQHLKLQQQILKFRQLMQNYRAIAPRVAPQNQPPQNNAKRLNATTTQVSRSMDLRSLLDSQLSLSRNCTMPCCTVPTCSGSILKYNLLSNPSKNDSSTSGGFTVRTGGSFSCPKVQINKFPNSCAHPPALQSCDSAHRKQAIPTVINRVSISPNSTEARSDSTVHGEAPEEFVDFECYFGKNDNIDVAMANKVKESNSGAVEVPPKRRRLSDVEIIGEV